jgi:hypothetical protein
MSDDFDAAAKHSGPPRYRLGLAEPPFVVAPPDPVRLRGLSETEFDGRQWCEFPAPYGHTR